MSEFERAIKFDRSMRIPDVGDRTNNDPCYLMSSNDVLKLIKSIHPDGIEITVQSENNPNVLLRHGTLSHVNSGKEVIIGSMVEKIIKEATTQYDWSEVKLVGKQLLFIK